MQNIIIANVYPQQGAFTEKGITKQRLLTIAGLGWSLMLWMSVSLDR
ncbi:hypothetical protein [Xenorhabdus khoisanae]|nr:hypothetical protein [Xenorhabdus khoisanae]